MKYYVYCFQGIPYKLTIRSDNKNAKLHWSINIQYCVIKKVTSQSICNVIARSEGFQYTILKNSILNQKASRKNKQEYSQLWLQSLFNFWNSMWCNSVHRCTWVYTSRPTQLTEFAQFYRYTACMGVLLTMYDKIIININCG